MKYILFALISLSTVACAHRQYDVSPGLIDSTPHRSVYYLNNNAGVPNKIENFVQADKNVPVVVHSHGCSGMSWYDGKIKEFYLSLGYNVVMLDFLRRGDAESSCPANKPLNTGHFETINPNRQSARLAELESQINWLRLNGFTTIIVTGYSEGGKTIQQLRTKVHAVIVHSMDCKSHEFYNPNKNNRYLFLYSYNDPWITGDGAYQTKSCVRLFSSNITENISNVRSHDPFADPEWKPTIVEFLTKK